MNPVPHATDSVAAASVISRSGILLHGSFFLLLLSMGVAIYFTPVLGWLAERQALQAELAAFGWAAPLVFIGLSALLSAVGAPRLLLCSLAGAAFGWAEGLLWSQAGTLLGAYLTFLAVRCSGREPILRRYPRLDRFTGRIAGRGLVAVLLLRQLPMNGFYNNLLLGLSPVTHRHFLLGSLLGYLPLGITAVLIGAGLMQSGTAKIAGYAAAALAVFVVLGFGLKRLARAKAGPVPSARTGISLLPETDGSERRPIL